MCFILNFLNSCSFNKKKSPSKTSPANPIESASLPTANKQPTKQTSQSNNKPAINHHHHHKSLSEKTPLESDYYSHTNSSKLTTLDTTEKLKEKFFKAKHYSKLESEPDSSCRTPSVSKKSKSSKISAASHIVDYCNECGFYCCECNNNTINTTNTLTDSTNSTISQTNSFYIDTNTLNYYFNLHNSFVNQIINNDSEFYSSCYSNQNCKTVYCQPTSNDYTSNNNNNYYTNYNTLDSSSVSSKMKSNFNNNNNNNHNKPEFSFVLSTPSSLASSTPSTTSSNRLNPFLRSDESTDVEMKIEDNNISKSHHIPFEKPNLNLFAQRFSNNDVDMEKTYHPNLQHPQIGQPPGLFTSSKPKQTGLTLNCNLKKKIIQYSPDQIVFAKPNEPDDRNLSDKLDLENKLSASLVRNRSHKRKHRDGKIIISKDQVYEFRDSDLMDLGQIGYGEFGTVHKVLHSPSQTLMALKRIRPTVGSQGERKKILKELDFVLECHDCTHVVKFYGVKLNNEPAENLICMELMDTSLEKFYKFVYEKKKEEIPESILGKIVVATVNALNYLKDSHQIIHRDVKPSNILINKQGEIKMCDFGISGKLVDSIAASRDAGCQLYMAPERIDPRSCTHGYDVRSDVWSLGITLYELSTGKFPYPQWKTIFHQLNLVVDSDAPRLEAERLSKDFCDFVNTCLTKDESKRPKYKELLQHPLILNHKNSNVNVSEYVTPYINEMQKNG